ncbi:ubiquitin-60S ribosomal L40 [Lecanosticta acicola]|uniref:Ubiquitin-60S ribosomal L40 n=1 Tax=Lecanosticta acicola TaxID=111012 RepID=A0AAI9E829_9PEZI|nr:ubiquitin-60S ribosomal L40 [Lecanosticta acicola]
MSLNLTVTVPLEAILAVQAAADGDKTQSVTNSKIVEAVVAAIEALPCRIQPKDTSAEQSVSAAPKPAPVYSTARFDITVHTYMGRTFHQRVSASSTVNALRSAIQDHQGIPSDHQRLFYQGQLMGGDPDADGLEAGDIALGTYGLTRTDKAHLYLT